MEWFNHHPRDKNHRLEVNAKNRDKGLFSHACKPFGKQEDSDDRAEMLLCYNVPKEELFGTQPNRKVEQMTFLKFLSNIWNYVPS